MPAKTSTYKGNAILELTRSDDDKFPFRFGVGKAMLILENFETICDFVKEQKEAKESGDDETPAA